MMTGPEKQRHSHVEVTNCTSAATVGAHVQTLHLPITAANLMKLWSQNPSDELHAESKCVGMSSKVCALPQLSVLFHSHSLARLGVVMRLDG